MAAKVTWLEDKQIRVEPPKRPKKITGTRFASILGLNPWATPFETWCAITKTYEKPFEDTKYTLAGKTIEPKQAEYMRKCYYMDDLVTPTDKFGEGYFNTTRGDFFHEHSVLGGMWDYVREDATGPYAVLEMKTTKRSEDWKKDIPEYYALQAALYAYLLGVDEVVMVCSFLKDSDYDNPESFVCSAENTVVRPFRVSQRYPNFQQMVNTVLAWWNTFVESGVSPVYDEKKDADILKELRTANVDPNGDLAKMIAEAERLKWRLDENAIQMEADEKRYKALCEGIKEAMKAQLSDGDTKATLKGKMYAFNLTVSTKQDLDKDAMKKDGIYEHYLKTGGTVYTLKPSALK